jgi:octaheme c-type cytochrome (tetrathionate reductase family)
MKRTEWKNSFLNPIILMTAWLMLWPIGLSDAQSNESQAPGRIMAQQAAKSQKLWNTTDHIKHKALQKDFKSGLEVTRACLSCHSEAETQFHKSIHWTWLADPADTEKQFGKAGNSLNNFCISTNKATDKSCLACHPGWGTSMESGINCLVCHSRKEMNWDEAMEDINAFLEAGDDDSVEIAKEIQAELQEAAQSVGRPGRQNCGSCHFYGGGGDGVKHGDLDSSLAKPNKVLDVHMGVDSQNFECVRCHNTTLHNIAGRVYTLPAAKERKSLIEDDLASKITCESCHTDRPHMTGSKANDHTDTVACQSCHIPEFARVNPTKMSWDWSQAGKTNDGKKYKTKDAFGQTDYMTIKGQMKWAKNIQPQYLWYNGIIKSVTAKDQIDPSQPVKVSWPVGSRSDANARIYPFKVHRGNQPYDTQHNTLLVPLLEP